MGRESREHRMDQGFDGSDFVDKEHPLASAGALNLHHFQRRSSKEDNGFLALKLEGCSTRTNEVQSRIGLKSASWAHARIFALILATCIFAHGNAITNAVPIGSTCCFVHHPLLLLRRPAVHSDQTRRVPGAVLVRNGLKLVSMQAEESESQGTESGFKVRTPGVVRKQQPSTDVDRRVRLRSWKQTMKREQDMLETGALPALDVAASPTLDHITVVLLGTKRPVTVGMVARACASFEVGRLIIVNSRVRDRGGLGVLQRSAMRASKGALQHSMAGGLDWMESSSVEEALSCCKSAVAFTRWEGEDMDLLCTQHPPLVACMNVSGAQDMTYMSNLSELAASLPGPPQEKVGQGASGQGGIAFVFGREDVGFVAGDLACTKIQSVCCIPMSSRFGTESLSLSQAVPIVLARVYEDVIAKQQQA